MRFVVDGRREGACAREDVGELEVLFGRSKVQAETKKKERWIKLNAGAVGMKAGRAMIELAQMRQLEQHRHVIPCRGHAAF